MKPMDANAILMAKGTDALRAMIDNAKPIQPEPEPIETKSNGADKTTSIPATRFVLHNPADIPPRRWLYRHHYVRQFLTCTIASGGVGKSSLAIAEALAMATMRPLLGITPDERARVWIWNGEDPAEELERRITAAMLQHGLTQQDIEGYLFADTGRKRPIIIAEQTKSGTVINRPVIEAMIATIRREQIDAVIIDPFVKSHRVSENDNMAIDLIAQEWAAIADATNCAIELLHHPRKTGGGEITVEDGRGASALLSASRSARVLNRMTKDDAANAGLEDKEAWRFFRVDNGKASMAPPPECAGWYRLLSVELGNGDSVGVATAWSWPNPFEGVSTQDLRAAQRAVDEGGPWRANHQAEMWVGKPIAKALRINVADKAGRAKVRSLIDTWTKNGMFVVVTGKTDDRHKTQFVEVGERATD